MQEGDDDKAAVSRADSTEKVDCSEIALVTPAKKIPLNSNQFFKENIEQFMSYKPLDEVINDRNFINKEVVSIDTANQYRLPPTFGTAFAED